MDNMAVMTGDVLDLNAYKTYGEYKEALDGELQESAESFVRIGYLLKIARDTDILAESEYSSVNEFAEKEYNLDKSQVSRFIRINDEFSENGYSNRLQERYRSFGYTKLAMMLLLPAEINEELSGNYSKAEIRAVKEEVDEEKKISDLEVMFEEKDGRQQGRSVFGKVLHQLGKDDPEKYLGMYEAVCNTAYDETIRTVADKLMEVLAPAGEAIISVRIAGEGRKMFSIKGPDADPALVDVRSGEKTACTWDQLIDEIEVLCPDVADGQKAWEILYGEPFPEKKEAVAPVQPKKGQEQRKVNKVTKAKKPEKTGVETVPDAVENGLRKQEKEAKEAAGVEDEESRKEETQGADCADVGPAGEHADDIKHADAAHGADGGAGEDSIKGSTDCKSGTEDIGAKSGQGTDSEAAGVAEGLKKPEKSEKTGMEDDSARGEDADREEKVQGAAGVNFANTDGFAKHVEKEKEKIRKKLIYMESLCISGDWAGLVEEAGYVITLAESIKSMKEVLHG